MCRALARELKLPVADEAFLAGMIHDLGFLLNMQTAPDKLRDVCKLAAASTPESPVDFCAAERQIIGVDHQQLGQALCDHWRFPKICQAVAGHHHSPADANTDSDDIALMVRLVWAADTACCQQGFGFNLTAKDQLLDDAALQPIGLTRSAVDRIAAGMQSTLSDAVAALGG
jgi:hypothetical protein